MPSHIDDVIALIQDTLEYVRRHTEPILAAPEDCDYFRKKFKKSPNQPSPFSKTSSPEIKQATSISTAPALQSQIPEKLSEPLEISEEIRPIDAVGKPHPPTSLTITPIGQNTPNPSNISEENRSFNTVDSSNSLTAPPVAEAVRREEKAKRSMSSERDNPELAKASEENRWINPSSNPNPLAATPVIAATPTISLQRWKSLFAKIAPDCPVIAEIPSDVLAKKISTRWKTKTQTAPITLLWYQENAEHKLLLEQICKALDVHFGSAKLASAESIEREKQWEAFLSVPELSLVICCDYTLWQLPGLLQFYKEIPSQGLRLIGEKPLFLLPDLSLYLKDPLLKRSLWKALCQICNPALQQSSSTKT